MSLTASNIVLTLGITTLFPTPVQLQGFPPDEVYDIPMIRSMEVQMGVDGKLSGGFVFTAVAQRIVLQADSLSNQVFDTWWSQMQAAQQDYPANGVIILPSLATKLTMTNGKLTGYTPAAPARRILQPRPYEITWERVVSSPA